MSDAVVIGKFGRAHGVRGEVRLFVFNPDSTLVAADVELTLVGAPAGSVVITSVRQADKFLIVTVDGITDREGAERLRSREVSVPRDTLPEPDDDEFYLVDVVGFEVWAATSTGDEPRLLGQVKGWLDIGPHDIMAVTGPEISGRMLVPHVDHVVERIDFDLGRVQLQPLDQWAAEDA